MGRDLGIANRLRQAAAAHPELGIKVVEVAGWQTRGSDSFNPQGVVDHHTAGPSAKWGDAPSLGTVINGRADLSGPLANVLTARDNTVYVVASGRANHAGLGGWDGMSGNSSVYGNERENVGTDAEPFTDQQNQAAAVINAALLAGCAHPNPSNVCEHYEWAPQRKVDAWKVSGPQMRSRVASLIANGGAPVLTPSEPPVPEEIPVADNIVFRASSPEFPPNADGTPGALWLLSAAGLQRLKDPTAVGAIKSLEQDGVTMADVQGDKTWYYNLLVGS